ncbi:MAG: gamma-glutamyl-phosphate reductase, partial [Rhodospirillales bacterium]|nr:gamma-glutamyl-phosphate reductase [Rhodospirillales bacterium]
MDSDATQHLQQAAEAARRAAHVLARTPTERRNAALQAMAAALRQEAPAILAANAADLAGSNATPAFRDRLMLNPARVEAMAKGLEEVAALPDPV